MEIYLKFNEQGEEDSHLASVYNNLGGVWDDLKDYQTALDYYMKALQIDLTVYGEAHPIIGVRYHNIGAVCEHLEEQIEVIDYYQKALNIYSLVYDEVHPNFAFTYNNTRGCIFLFDLDIKKLVEEASKRAIYLNALVDELPSLNTPAERKRNIKNQRITKDWFESQLNTIENMFNKYLQL